MFEKEAEEYVNANKVCLVDIDDKGLLEEAYKDGAEFGYNKAFVEADKNLKAVVADFNKANEWHYVKDGDLPKTKGNYLVAWKRVHQEYSKWGFDVVLFDVEEEYFEGVKEPIAWKEIVLPELKESE